MAYLTADGKTFQTLQEASAYSLANGQGYHEVGGSTPTAPAPTAPAPTSSGPVNSGGTTYYPAPGGGYYAGGGQSGMILPSIPEASTQPQSYSVAAPSVTTTPTLTNQLAGLQAGYSLPTSNTTTKLAQLATDKTNEQVLINKYRQAVLDAMNPSGDEANAQAQLAAISKQIRDFGLSTQAGLDNTAAQPIPMAPIIGQQQNILNNSTRVNQQLNNNASTVSDLLKTFQSARQGVLTKAQTQLGFANDDMASILGMEKDLQALSKEERDYANQILEFAVNTYTGIRSSDIKNDPTLMAQLTDLANRTGMPINMILQSIDTATSKLSNDVIISTNNAGVVSARDKRTGALLWQTSAGVENAKVTKVGSPSGATTADQLP